nr:helix-turn-helix domain-containing protein [Cronobacter sakazakii]
MRRHTGRTARGTAGGRQNESLAARKLGVSRSTLYRRLEKQRASAGVR